ncbi:YktB family protein [Paenibacillus sp. UNC499MF]|uniref:YktB family protein n=1 Tax=Paenibacillus sp. UNC499MF TaxID=1502751 RepID=UPI00089FC787|nr:DUF1054 domain-containing protein [Paenibacillus sp. UNC499MF]SEF53393.1 Uncharacterized protein YktB, UPF0637 family [Paenibacillus sp. UNC499MF]
MSNSTTIRPDFMGFGSSDFETFAIDGLDERMKAIQERIQPKFKILGEILCEDIALHAGTEMHLHIARHARRTVNPPKDTWLAIAANKRGYKQHPHFQIGLFDDHVFLWFALIYEVPDKKAIAGRLLANQDELYRSIPEHYVLSFDHMQKRSVPAGDLTTETFGDALLRFRDVKKAEFLVGRHFDQQDPLLQKGDAFIQMAKETFESLMPFYLTARG